MTDELKTDDTTPEKPPFNWGKLGILITTLALVLFVLAFGYAYFELSKLNVKLAKTVGHFEDRLNQTENEMSTFQKTAADLQTFSQQSEAKAKEQAQLLAQWQEAQKGDKSKWQLAEANYLVKLANDQLQFGHNIEMALILLKQADQVMQNVNGTTDTIRKSLSEAIAGLQAIPSVDMNAIFLQLTALNKQLDQLPLPNIPLAAEKTTAPIATNLPWWKKGLAYTWDAMGKVVIVRKDETGKLPFILPDQKNFLYQNLHAQIEQAIWGLLHRNATIYQSSLQRASDWINQFFDQNAPETKTMRQQLEELRKINIEPPNINLNKTLQLFSDYASSQPTTVKPGQ